MGKLIYLLCFSPFVKEENRRGGPGARAAGEGDEDFVGGGDHGVRGDSELELSE